MRKTFRAKAVRYAIILALAGLLYPLLAFNRSASAQPQDKGGQENGVDLAAIRSVMDQQQAAWNRGDVGAFLKGYWESPELTFSGDAGTTRGFAGVQERYRRNYPDQAAMGELKFSELEFRFLGPKAALVLGHWHLTREKGDVGGVFSLVWQKFPQGWKIVHDHTSQVDEKK